MDWRRQRAGGAGDGGGGGIIARHAGAVVRDRCRISRKFRLIVEATLNKTGSKNSNLLSVISQKHNKHVSFLKTTKKNIMISQLIGNQPIGP